MKSPHVPIIETLHISHLVKRAQRGDKIAFGTLYEKTVERVYRFMLFRVRQREEAEDLTEIVYVKVLEHLKEYKDQGLPFVAWLFRIARNVVIDYWRQKKHVSLTEHQHVTHEEEHIEQVYQEQRKEMVWKALSQVAKSDQEIVTFRFIEDLSYEEIAGIMGKTQGAVRVMLHRALVKLKKQLYGKL